MSKRILAIIISVLLVGGAVWWIIPHGDAPDLRLKQGSSEKAPAFSLLDYSGKTVHLSDFEGKPLVINLWAAWCPFCRKELVDFAAAQKEFGDKVTIVAANRAESLETAKKYSDELGVTSDLIFLLDPEDSFYRAIGGFSMPETIFINSNGETIFHKRGPMDLEEIRQEINQLIPQ